MIAFISGLPTGIFGFEAQGTLDKGELDEAGKRLTSAAAGRESLRLLLDFSPDTHFKSGAEGGAFVTQLLTQVSVERIALVGGDPLQELFQSFIAKAGYDGRVFPAGEREAALAWLQA